MTLVITIKYRSRSKDQEEILCLQIKSVLNPIVRGKKRKDKNNSHFHKEGGKALFRGTAHTQRHTHIPHAANRMGTRTSLHTGTRCFQDAHVEKEIALLRLTPSVILSTSFYLVNPTKFVSSLSFFPCLCRLVFQQK